MNNAVNQPLAKRMAPQDLSEFVGQEHLLAKGKVLRTMIDTDRISSLILYGPPGSGKTALAMIIAKLTKSSFERLNAVTSGVPDLRKVVARARSLLESGERTTLFIDEIHRYNKAQQDALLPEVEEGIITLIGATTQNPYFYLNNPLLSRSSIFEFQALSNEHLKAILQHTLKDKQHGLGARAIKLDHDARDFLLQAAEGDARRLLNLLEIAVNIAPQDKSEKTQLTMQVITACCQGKHILYDGTGDEHYDVISAFIKSMRGSDPDSALYWLALMLTAGDDPRFIARRIAICASEDVGNADPRALQLATAAMQAVEYIGMPEAQLTLAQATTYIASAPKSNAAAVGIWQATKEVREKPLRPVPTHLKDASYPGGKKLGRGEGYKYSHDYPKGYVKQFYGIEAGKFYQPKDSGYEKKLKEWLAFLRNKK